MAINIVGLIAIIIFYLVILVVGIWAAKKKGTGATDQEEVMLAGRNIGLFVGIFTMTATWVGGGYINGTAEAIFSQGLIWCQAPFGYALSLMFGGILFANKMREQGYVTMLDPFQDLFGERMGGLLFIPALCGEVFWSAAILGALGATLSVILNIDSDTAVIASALIAIFYTLFGGLYAVAYTDVIQLFCIFIGLWLCIPFAMANPATGSISPYEIDWIGSIENKFIGQYIDCGLLLIFGGIPWQVYFQRVLSSKTADRAQTLSYVAAVGCIIMAIPPVMIGAVAKATAWNETEYGKEVTVLDQKQILPMVLQYLTPQVVSFFGLGAVSAAVMSSADSSVLGASSMFARNVYKCIFRQRASEKEIIWVMRAGIFVVGGLATAMALTIPTIYGLWYLCADLVYVILFPQLVGVVHMPTFCNTYGSLSAYIIGFLLRFLGGEALLFLPPLVHYPFYDEVDGQLFPFRTLAMLVSFGTLLSVSHFTRWLFESYKLPPSYDVFRCVVNIPDDVIKVQDPHEDELSTLNTGPVKSYLSGGGLIGGELNGQINPALSIGNEEEEDEDELEDRTRGRIRAPSGRRTQQTQF